METIINYLLILICVLFFPGCQDSFQNKFSFEDQEINL
jgi:hypothetical protein